MRRTIVTTIILSTLTVIISLNNLHKTRINNINNYKEEKDIKTDTTGFPIYDEEKGIGYVSTTPDIYTQAVGCYVRLKEFDKWFRIYNSDILFYALDQRDGSARIVGTQLQGVGGTLLINEIDKRSYYTHKLTDDNEFVYEHCIKDFDEMSIYLIRDVIKDSSGKTIGYSLRSTN